jgi:hypothetical protein
MRAIAHSATNTSFDVIPEVLFRRVALVTTAVLLLILIGMHSSTEAGNFRSHFVQPFFTPDRNNSGS